MAGCACTPDLDGAGEPKFRRVLWIALLANGAMFIVEIVASILSGSVSLQADALDFFGDTVTYGISLCVLGLSLRARSAAALVKSAMMASFGVWVIGSATYRALTDAVPDAAIMGVTGMLALAVNVAVAALLFRYRDGDSNRRSIWLCSRNDAIGNIAVLLAASGVVITATGWPDIVVATVIAGLSVTAAYQVFGQARREMRYARAVGAS